MIKLLPPLKKERIFLWFFILLKMGLHGFLINPIYELHRDEFLHLDQGHHLAWGYLSVPPVTSWISYLIILLGSSVFWVKFFPALFGALTIAVVWKAVKVLKGGLFALSLSAIAVTFSAFLRINILYQPNSLDFLCWTIVYFLILQYLIAQRNSLIWLMALFFTVGFLNKYNIAFQIVGLLPAFLVTPHRKILLNKHLYFSIVGVLVLISSNLLWQYQNDFPVFYHLQALAETQLVHVKRMDFLKDQFLFFMGSFLIIIAALLSFFFYRPFKEYRVFFWSFLFTMSLFVLLQAKSYYAMGLYPILLAFGSVYLEKLLSKNWHIYLRPFILAIPILMFLPLWKVIFPVLPPDKLAALAPVYEKHNLFRWEDGQNHLLPQDFADMLGWKELANKVDVAYEQLDEKTNLLIFCDNYGQAGAINYYSRHKNLRAVSMSADYIHWIPLDMEIKHMILVKDKWDTDKNREKEKPYFHTVDFVGEIENPYAREKGTRIYILKNAKVSVNDILRKEIQNRDKF